MIGERMADRQPGPLMPGGKAYTTGELVSLANKLGTDPQFGVMDPMGTGWDWASPEASSSMINFPSPVSAADIQDVQRRGIRTVDPRRPLKDWSVDPQQVGWFGTDPQTEMFGERMADRPAGTEFSTNMNIQSPTIADFENMGAQFNKAMRQGLTDFSWRDDPAMRAFSEIYAPLTTQIPLGPLGDLNPMNTALNMMTPALMNLAGRINPDDLGNLYTRPVSPGVIPGQDPFTVSPTMAIEGRGPTHIDDFKRRAKLFSSFVR
jgi:hypothetical protein